MTARITSLALLVLFSVTGRGVAQNAGISPTRSDRTSVEQADTHAANPAADRDNQRFSPDTFSKAARHLDRAAREPGLQGKIIVKMSAAMLAHGLTPALFADVAARYGIISVKQWIEPKLLRFGMPAYKATAVETPEQSLARIMVVEYTSLDAPGRVADAVGKIAGVEYAEPIYPRRPLYTPNDLEISKQWYLDAIQAKEAWDITRADSTILVAITDTGIERFHDDLKDAVWYNPGENGDGPNGDKRFDGIDNDNNGIVDDWWGYDFSGSNGDNPDNDPSGVGEPHGTEVAGIVAATGDNNLGIAGIAFGAKVLVVKVADDRAYPNNRIYNGALGVLYAAKMEAKVINCSWGGVERSRSEAEVFAYVVNNLHKLVVAAAGNDGDESDFYPAAYPGVLDIGALTSGTDKADFSNYTHRIDLSAPGTDIYTSVFGSLYTYDRGTSFSAPMVTGVAALLFKHFQGYSSEKIAEILRATTDDFTATLTPAYAGKMGTGKLNALRALQEGGTVISARMVDYTVEEANPDGAFDAGETVRIRANIKNILADAPSVTATLVPVSDPTIQLNGSVLQLGAMASGDARTSPDSVFQFTIPASTPPNTDIVLKMTVATKDRTNNQYITIHAVPTYLTTDLNSVAATFNSTGNIGHNGLNQQQGDGFVYGGSDDFIYHAGLMIGTDAEHVADVVRSGHTADGVNDGFHFTRPYRLKVEPDSSLQTGTAEFNDAHLPVETRVGVNVEMTTYEYRHPMASNIVRVAYRIHNTGATTLTGLRCGLYLDWDISSSSYTDQVGYDPDHHLAYQRDAADPATPWIGATLLSPQDMSFYAVDNFNDSATTAFYLGRKWAMMSSGIHEDNEIDDMAMVVSGGPITLAPGAWTDVEFALMAAPSFDSLRATADIAHSQFHSSTVTLPGLPGEPTFSYTEPNPFKTFTTLHVTTREPGTATLTIFNLRGEQVATVFDGRLDMGAHEFPFNAEALPDGAYIYNFHGGGVEQHGTLIKMR